MSEERQRYAALLRKAKGRMSVRTLGGTVGLAGSTVQDYVTGRTLPTPEVHEALVNETVGRGAPGSEDDRLRMALDDAYAAAAGTAPPVDDGRLLVMTLGQLPLRLLGQLLPAIEQACAQAGYVDVKIEAGLKITAVQADEQ